MNDKDIKRIEEIFVLQIKYIEEKINDITLTIKEVSKNIETYKITSIENKVDIENMKSNYKNDIVKIGLVLSIITIVINILFSIIK